MNSEKVKEIKKGLECCKQNEIEDTCKYCLDCPASDWDYEKTCTIDLFQKTITLINELESENEELRVVTDIANERTYRKKFTDEWRKEYQKELDKQGNGHIAGHPDFDLVYKLYFEQKNRIAELEKENRQLSKAINNVQKGFDNGEFISKDCQTKTLKQFVEKLKEHPTMKIYSLHNACERIPKAIDETLKEYEK